MRQTTFLKLDSVDIYIKKNPRSKKTKKTQK
jgi:hypothetical protein